MRHLLAHPRRCGLTALAAIVVTLASAAVASGDPSVGARGGPPTTNEPAPSGGANIVVAQNGAPDENQTPATFAITTASLPTPVLNQVYGQTVVAAGGLTPVTFTLAAGSLPAGMSLAGNGAITGAPTATGTFGFTVEATDSNSNTVTHAYAWTIAEGLAITTTGLPAPVLDQPYSQTIAISGGAAPVNLSASGTLPAGLYFADGAIVGTPNEAGPYRFTIRAADANGSTATQTYSGTVAATLATATTSLPTSGLAIITTSMPPPVLNRAYSQTIATSGGAAPVSLSVSGALPTGLYLADGAIAGTPTEAGSYSFTVNASDANGALATQAYSGTIAADMAADNGADANGQTATQAYGGTSPAPLVANAVNATVGYDSTDNPIALDISGPADRVAVLTRPAHGRAFARGTSIVYTPWRGYSGSDDFEYRAANTAGASAPATIVISVVKAAHTRVVGGERWDRCAATDPDTAISGCITLIESGHLSSAQLALAYNNKGIAEAVKGSYDQAISDFTMAIAAKSDEAAVYVNRGVAYDSKGQTDQAIADYSKAVALQPDNATAYVRRGKDYRSSGLADQAIADFTQAIRLRPTSAEAYDDRAGAYSSKGSADEAIADLTQAIALKPNFAQAYVDRSTIYMNRGLQDQAIADSTEAITLRPNDAGSYVNRAAAYIAKGLYDQAIGDATRAIALQPDNALAYNNRAVADNRKRLWDQGIGDATQAITLEPDYALAYFNRAVAEAAKGLQDQAVGDLRAALEIDPTLQIAHNALYQLGARP